MIYIALGMGTPVQPAAHGYTQYMIYYILYISACGYECSTSTDIMQRIYIAVAVAILSCEVVIIRYRLLTIG